MRGSVPVQAFVSVGRADINRYFARPRPSLSQKTVPYVYVNHVMVGGCDNTKRLHADGELTKMLHAAGVKVAAAAATDMDARLGR